MHVAAQLHRQQAQAATVYFLPDDSKIVFLEEMYLHSLSLNIMYVGLQDSPIFEFLSTLCDYAFTQILNIKPIGVSFLN